MFVIVSSGPRHSRNSFIKFPKSDSTLALFFQYLTVVGVPMDYELPCNPLDVQQKHPEKRHNSLKNRYKFSCPGSKSRLVIFDIRGCGRVTSVTGSQTQRPSTQRG